MRFAFWGGVGRHKGVDVLIDAYRLLAREDAELHVLGGFESPAFARELREHAKGLSVHFHGPFTAADLRKVGPQVGVFPSTCIETFGIVLDECNELGLPCIVSDQGALPERVGSGGLVVPVGDAAALAAAMGRIMDDAELRERLVAQLPALPPSMSAHAKALELIYEAARKSGPHEGPRRVSLDRRIDFLAMQRETAMGRQGHPRDPD